LNYPDLTVTTFTIFGGLLCIISYALVKGDQSNLGDGSSVFLCGTGIVSGSYLCLISLSKFVCENVDLEQNRPYIFMGGAAVLWLSTASLRAKLKNAPIVSR
jgi:hypothetical protein